MTRREEYWIGSAKIVRRSVEVLPADGTLCFVEDMTTGRRGKSGGATFRAGEWVNARGTPIGWEPTHWSAFEEPEGKALTSQEASNA